MKTMVSMLVVAVAALGALPLNAGDDMAEYLATMERVDAQGGGKRPMCQNVATLTVNATHGPQSVAVHGVSDGMQTYTFDASGDLNYTVGEGTLDFTFSVDQHFTEIKSATLTMNAYDVDYPEATERDLVYFNGTGLGRLQGGNNTYHVNSFPVPVKLIKVPKQEEVSAKNTFYVAVDVDDLDWVTKISWATLTIVGRVGIKVSASDGTEPDKILVTVKSGKENEVVDLYRDGDFVASLLTDTVYDDYDIEWGKVYHYHAVGSNGYKSEPDEGYSGTLPAIKNVEVAELWLTGEGPYNLRVAWHDFDPKKVRVNNIRFRVVKTDSTTDVFEYETNARLELKGPIPQDFDLSSKGKVLELGHHGKYDIEITWDAYCVESGRIISDKDPKCKAWPMKYGGVTANVFYHKYEMHGNVPNWYYYWVKDGTLTDTSRIALDYHDVYDDNYHYANNLGKNRAVCSPYAPSRVIYKPKYIFGIKTQSDDKRFPPIRKYGYQNTRNRYQCSDLVASMKEPVEAGRYGKVGVSNIVYGVKSFAANIPHERKHGDLVKTVNVPGSICIGSIRSDYIHTLVVDLGFPISSSPSSFLANIVAHLESKGQTDSEYYSTLKDCLAGKIKYTCDLDGDALVDDKESQFEKPFSFLKPNTYDWQFQDYLKYADNEILARKAEENPIGVNEEKDWAFPGCQVPKNDNGQTPLCGYKKGEWNSVRDSEKKRLQSIAQAPNGRMVQVQTRMVPESVVQGVEDRTSASIDRFPEFNTNGVESVITILETRVEAGGLVDDKYSWLAATVELDCHGEEGGTYRIEAYFADTNGRPMAKAWCEKELKSGSNELTLFVDGKIVYAQKSSGYSLKYLRVERADDEFASICGWGENLGSSVRELHYNDFVQPDALIDAVTFTGLSSTGDLTAMCKVELSEDASYEVVANLTDTNGHFVAMSSVGGIRGSGSRMVPIHFDRNAIYMSKNDGPYMVDYMVLKKDGVQVDTTCNRGVSDPYSWMDFAPEHLAVIARSDSFTVAKEFGGDGLVTALTCTFSVRNTLVRDSSYRVSMYLCGTNDGFVASSSSEVVLHPGDGIVSLSFKGDVIKRSNVSGPYYVRDVVLQPTDESGHGERFLPRKVLIDLNTDEFGSYPFELAGDPHVESKTGSTAYVVTVPLKIKRANTVTVSALLFDRDGRYVATAQKTVTYDTSTTDDVVISFSSADIAASGRRGPYTIRYLTIFSDLEGVEPLRVTSFKAEGLIRDYVIYVDKSANDDSGDGLSWLTAKRTIQAAVDNAQDGDVIMVADGVYEPFTCDNKAIEIVGLNGYKKTFINGGWTNRCATLGREESQTNTVLRGFSLVKGDATTDNVLLLWNCGGGVCCGSVYDCVISECSASKGGGAYYGRLESCLLTDNEAETYGGGSYYGERVNCTIYGNHARYGAGGTYAGSTRNSIVWDNTYGSYSTFEDNWEGGAFTYSVTKPLPDGEGNLSTRPGFSDAANGDFTLTRNSICIDAGDDAVVWGAKDLSGNDRVMGETVDIGAFERYYHQRTYGVVEFTASRVTVLEGKCLEIEVCGGRLDRSTSVIMYATLGSASQSDLDLAKGMIDGVVPKGGLKFPLTLNWAAGEVTNRVITIPVKADKAVEADEVLTFQLAAAQGQDIGEASVCTVTLVDANTAVTLQDGAMSATVKLTSKASKSGGAWNVAPGNMLDPDGSRGLYHAESPVLAPGGRSMLSAGPLSSGYLYFRIRFTGPVEEEKPSTVTVYRGNSFIGVIGHGTTLRDGWKVCASNDWNGVKVTFSGRGPINLVFTQGSDPTVHAEISCLRYDATDKDLPVYKILALPSDPSGGHVTGAGLYTKGAVVPLSAKPKPGWEFTGWYTYGTNETRRLWDNKANVSGKVVGDFEVFAEFVRMPYIRALADPADGGKVSGSGYCAAGKKVALKATASRNFTFAGWYAAGAPDAPVATTPTLVLDRSAKPAKSDARQTVLADVDGDATYFARFVGDPEVSVTVSATDGRGAEPAGKGAGRYVAGTVTGAGRYAPGKKAVLKATANRGYVFAGWREAGADGTLSRSAAYTIGAMPPDDVALVAAFVTADEDRESVAASLGGLPLAPWVSKTETHALATNVRAGVYLEWPLAASALSETTVKVAGLPAGLRFAARPVTSRSGTGRSAVLVTNVPANTVYGAPTAASRTAVDRRTGAVTVTPSAVKVTVTTAGRSSRTYQIDTTVDPLPAWAQGTFAGVSYADADGAETNGLAAVSVTAAGKVSAKQTAAGRAASFTAPWYDRHDAAEDAYHATLTAKVGAAVVTNRVTVRAAAHAATDAVPAETALGVMRGDLLDAWQTDWRREPWKGFAAALARARPPLAYAYEVVGDQPGTVALKFGANGAVTAAGTFATGVDARGRETTAKASCSATLLPQGGDRYLVFVYFPPKDTFRGHARCLALAWDGAGFVEDVAW